MAQLLEQADSEKVRHPEIQGSLQFETKFRKVIDQYGFPRSAVWRGHMPSTARFIYQDTLQASHNEQNILKADRYQSTTNVEEYFYYVYQKVIGKPDTVMTYILSSSPEPIKQKRSQIERYGTYSPKAYKLKSGDPIPVIDSYRGSCQVVTVDELINLFPDMKAYLLNESGIYFVTNRLATYLYDKTVIMEAVDGQTLKVKVFLNVGDQTKYVAEAMPADENGGIACFDNLRFEETNDPWYALSHHLHGPSKPPKIVEGDEQKIDATQYSGLSIAGGAGVIWIVGIPHGMPRNSLHYFNKDSQTQGDAVDFLFSMPAGTLPDDLFSEIKHRGLASLLPEGYQ